MDELPDAFVDAPDLRPPAASAPQTPLAPVTEPLTFTGDGWEYFKIWIVNVALTIATLGVYSAWAKVRRLQYFYRNTQLAGSSFDYLGDPIAIFKGRMIAGFLFVLYTFAGAISPFFALGVAFGIMLAMPWLLSRSLRFRLRNSSYRGVTFRFTGSTQSAYWVFLGLPLITVLTLGLMGPFWHQRMKRYQFTNAHFGRVRFGADPPVGDFYVTHIATLLIGGGLFFVLAAIVAILAGLAAAVSGAGEQMSDEMVAVGTLLAFVIAFPIYLVGIVTIQAFSIARIRNTVWSHTTLGNRVFTSALRTRTLLWIMLTNLLAMIVTLGFFWPFAQVRLAKYYAETLAMIGPPTFAEFEATPGDDENAVGEEVTDVFDFDISF